MYEESRQTRVAPVTGTGSGGGGGDCGRDTRAAGPVLLRDHTRAASYLSSLARSLVISFRAHCVHRVHRVHRAPRAPRARTDTMSGTRTLLCDGSGIVVAESAFRCIRCRIISCSMKQAQDHYYTYHMEHDEEPGIDDVRTAAVSSATEDTDPLAVGQSSPSSSSSLGDSHPTIVKALTSPFNPCSPATPAPAPSPAQPNGQSRSHAMPGHPRRIRSAFALLGLSFVCDRLFPCLGSGVGAVMPCHSGSLAVEWPLLPSRPTPVLVRDAGGLRD